MTEEARRAAAAAVDPPFGQLDVPAGLIRGAFADHDESIRSACWLIDLACDQLGVPDLGQTELLDVGCGVKFTQAFVELSLPVKKYVGCDVSKDLIGYLEDHVRDERFEYFYLPAHNARYNPDGVALEQIEELPIDGRTFDLITLFSVFTHLDPVDFRAMLKLVRRFADSETLLIFSLYLDELTEAGHGLVDAIAAALAERNDDVGPAVGEKGERAATPPGTRQVQPFRDLDPARPLLWALYSESRARELIDGTGWKVLSLSPPSAYIQHHSACTPC